MSDLFNGVWAIEPDAYRSLKATVESGLLKAERSPKPEDNDPLSSGEKAARLPGVTFKGKGNTVTAIIPIYGIISQRPHPVLSALGIAQAATDEIYAKLQELVGHGVDGIVLDINSPGGGVSGVSELANYIHAIGRKVPVVAISHSLAASAAYWIGAAANVFYVTPSSETGSIGVFTGHIDLSKQQQARGVKTTLIHAGRYKVEGSPYTPLNDEARAFTQKRVDEYYAMFLRDVERFRNQVMQIRYTDAGQGRVVGAKQAVKDGLADGVKTYPELLKQASYASRQRASTRLAILDRRTKTVSARDRLTRIQSLSNRAHARRLAILEME